MIRKKPWRPIITHPRRLNQAARLYHTAFFDAAVPSPELASTNARSSSFNERFREEAICLSRIHRFGLDWVILCLTLIVNICQRGARTMPYLEHPLGRKNHQPRCESGWPPPPRSAKELMNRSGNLGPSISLGNDSTRRFPSSNY